MNIFVDSSRITSVTTSSSTTVDDDLRREIDLRECLVSHDSNAIAES